MTKEQSHHLRVQIKDVYTQLFDLLYLEMPDSRAAFIKEAEDMIKASHPPLEMAKELNVIISARLTFLTEV